MSRTEKLIQSFLAEPSEVNFSDVEKLLELFGFEQKSCEGSHHIFRHEDGRKITVPTKYGRRVKKIYIKKINAILRLGESYDQEKD
jgi:predicted RNA binding protein YcfA (HicA-like mRNA interferase family)